MCRPRDREVAYTANTMGTTTRLRHYATMLCSSHYAESWLYLPCGGLVHIDGSYYYAV